MQITLNVEGSQLDQEVRELLKSLTDEQKNALAAQMLQNSLENTNSSLMRESIGKTIAERHNQTQQYNSQKVLYKEGQWYQFDSPNNFAPYEIRNKLEKQFNDMTQTSNFFRKEILSAMIVAAEKSVKEVVESDPTVKEAVAQTTAFIREQMPKMVHDAMMFYFSGQLQSMGTMLTDSLLQSKNQYALLEQLQQKMNNTQY